MPGPIAATLAAASRRSAMLPLYLPTGDGLLGLLSQTRPATPTVSAQPAAPDADGLAAHRQYRGPLIEGPHQESEDRDADGPLPRRRTDRRGRADRDLEGGRARVVSSRCSQCATTGWHRRVARRDGGRFPDPPEHRLPGCSPPVPPAAGWPVTRPGRCWPRWSDDLRPRPDQPGRVFSGTIRPDATVHVSGPACRPSAGPGSAGAHADHDEDRRIGTLSFPLGRSSGPAVVIAGDIADRPTWPGPAAYPVGQGRAAGAPSRGSCRIRCCPSPLPHAKTDEDKLSGGLTSSWPPRIRRCASGTIPRPTRSCSGAWGKRIPAGVLAPY